MNADALDMPEAAEPPTNSSRGEQAPAR